MCVTFEYAVALLYWLSFPKVPCAAIVQTKSINNKIRGARWG
jgi:hypothetical protein